jgi:hypothetical protein
MQQWLTTANFLSLAGTESPQGFQSILVYLVLSAHLPLGTIRDVKERNNMAFNNFKVSSQVINKLRAGTGRRTRCVSPTLAEWPSFPIPLQEWLLGVRRKNGCATD